MQMENYSETAPLWELLPEPAQLLAGHTLREVFPNPPQWGLQRHFHKDFSLNGKSEQALSIKLIYKNHKCNSVSWATWSREGALTAPELWYQTSLGLQPRKQFLSKKCSFNDFWVSVVNIHSKSPISHDCQLQNSLLLISNYDTQSMQPQGQIPVLDNPLSMSWRASIVSLFSRRCWVTRDVIFDQAASF